MSGREKENLPFRQVDIKAVVTVNAKVPKRLRAH